MPRELQPCGTPAAYTRHRRRGEPVDDACAEARKAEKRTQYANGSVPRGPLQPCGTNAAYERHRWHGEPIDEGCREAHRAWMRRYNRDRRRIEEDG